MGRLAHEGMHHEVGGVGLDYLGGLRFADYMAL